MYSEKREEKAELLEGLSIGKDDKTNVSPIQQDVMLIWGEQDQVFPLKMAHDLKEMLGTKATLKVIQKTSHIPQTEKSKEFNGFVMSFLLPPSPSP
ncbi:hypothetical protein AXX17_AT5G21280 [Arabidopsis thaliana]|nr:hypothetical protein AXX17_AT5G21280 [Arabidopsis thaliana]